MDILIQNASVIDGTGAPAFFADVGIEREKQKLLPPNSGASAKIVLDGTGLTVTPGFIDAHSHGDLTMRGEYATFSKLNQGITTQVAGQCGVSMFPASTARTLERFVGGIAPYPEMPEDLASSESYASFSGWMDRLQNPIHTYCFTGLGSLRLWAMGYENRKPDSTELSRMQKMLRRCIREGALGLSTGLVYAPCCYADNDEILSLLRVVQEEGGMYATHPRNEADTVLEARQESIRLAMEAGVPLCISHLKTAGRQNWGKSKALLKMVDDAVSEGLDALIDCYPYMAGNTSLNVSIPPRYFTEGLPGLVKALQSPSERESIREEMARPSNYDNYIYNSGGFSGTLVSSCPVFHDAEGMRITEYAQKTGQTPFDAYCEILIKNGGLGLGVYFHMSREDVTEILRHPLTAISTDGLVGLPSENPHPRSFGTMGRAYRMLVHEEKICSPEAAIRKMTGLAAEKLGLTGKGHVADGMDGDLLLLDLDAFQDTATYENGNGLCSGVNYVISAGSIVCRDGRRI